MVVVILIIIAFLLFLIFSNLSQSSSKNQLVNKSNKLVNPNMNTIDKERLANIFIRRMLEDSILKAHNSNPLKDSPMGGYFILNAFNKSNEFLIQMIPDMMIKFDLSENRLKDLIKENSRQVYNQTFLN